MRVRSSRFVGREAELAQLAGWLEEAREGRPRVVIVGGEAGVGKSRLVEEFRRIADERGAAWLFGAAADYGAGGLPFGALVQAFRPIASEPSVIARLGPARAELARLFPSLGASHAGQADDATAGNSDGFSQVRLLEALLGLLVTVARQRPVVLVLEDIHWADASTRELLAFLARNLGGTPLLVVATYRSDDVGRGHPLRRYLAELGRLAGVERLDLSRLDRSELRQLAEAIRGRDLDDDLVGRLYARSQGNAYFSEELLAAADSHPAMTLPGSVRDLLLARLEALAETTRAMLAAAAVIGSADEQLLREVTGLAEADVTRALHEAIDHAVLEPAGGTDGRTYAFHHALAKEAIYGDLVSAERRRLHRRVAEVLAAGAPGLADDGVLPARLAHHWRSAGEPREALAASWRAGEASERMHAYPEASLHYEHTLEFWDSVAEAGDLTGVDRAEVAYRAGRAAHWANDHARGTALLRSALESLGPEADAERAAQVRLELLPSLVMGGETEAARGAREELEALGPACSTATRLDILNRLTWYFEHFGDLTRSLELAREALPLAEATGDDRRIAALRGFAGRSSAFLEDPAQGLAELELALAIARRAGVPDLSGTIEKDVGIVLQSAGRYEEAIAAFERSQRQLEPLGLRNTTRHTEAEIAFALHRLGRWQEADAALERALIPPAIEWGYVVRAYVLVATGRLEEAERELRRAWPSVEASQASTSFGPYFTALGHKALWEGRPVDALAAAEEGLRRVATTQNFRWICESSALGVRAAADAGATRRADGEGLLDVLRSRTNEGRPEMRMFEAEGRAWLATAEAEMSRFDDRPDPAAWERAVGAWRATGRPHELAYVLFRQAEATLASGPREDARAPLSEAWAQASLAGARLIVGAIEGLARRARLEVGEVSRAAATADSYGLTARERDVLALLARGSTDQQIAETLFISPKTASVHVSNIKAKLGVEHRIEAATIGAALAEPRAPDG